MTQITPKTGIEQILDAEAKAVREKMAADQINPQSPEAAEMMKAALSGAEDRTWKGAYEKAMENLYTKGIGGIKILDNENDISVMGSRYVTADEDVESFARLAADQYIKGMKPITWAEYNDKKRSLPKAMFDGLFGMAAVSWEGMIGTVAAGGAGFADRMAMVAEDIVMSAAPTSPAGEMLAGPRSFIQAKNALLGLSAAMNQSSPEDRREIVRLERMQDARQSGAEFGRAVFPAGRGYLEEVAGPAGQPVLASERYGIPGGSTGEFLVGESENIGAAIGSLPMSAPSMLARDPLTRAAAMVPFAFSGYGDAQLARYDIWKEQTALAEQLGIAPPPLPSAAEFETWGAIGAGFEVGSEFVGDTLQVGAIKFGLGKKFGRLPVKKINEWLVETQRSLGRTRGPVGVVKRAATATLVPGVMEGLEEVVPHAGQEVQDLATQVLFTPDDSYWNDAGPSREFFSEDSFHSFKVGAYSGALLGGGAYVASPTAFRNRREAREVRDEVRKGTSFVTESLTEQQNIDAAKRLVPPRTTDVVAPGATATKNQARENFRRSVLPTRSSPMAMHHIEGLRAGWRKIMVVDPADMDTTLTPEVRDHMKALGISTTPIGTIDGKKVFAANGDIAEVRDLIARGKWRELGGNPLRNDGQVMMGAVVLRDNAGRVVDILPYSDANDLDRRGNLIQNFADQNGYSVELINHDTRGGYAAIEDSVRRAQDADAAQLGLAKRETRTPARRDVKRGVNALRMDISNGAKGSKVPSRDNPRPKKTDPFKSNGYLNEEEIGDATNGDVTVTVTLSQVAADQLSKGERQLIENTDANATILDGKVVFSIKQKDGSVKTIEKPIRSDGAYMPQSSPDGVFLIREDGTAMNARSAMALGIHEMRHRTMSRSRSGAEYGARLLHIDPVFALRGGAAYMRSIYGKKFAGKSDAQMIAYYRGLHEAVEASLQGVATPAQQQTVNEAGGLAAARMEVNTFAQESVSTTANRALGKTFAQAADWDAVYKDSSELSYRRFASWFSNALVRNGFVGPEAQQALFELRQRLEGVREEELQIHRKFSDDVRDAVSKDLEQAARQQQAREELRGATGGAAPSSTPAAASTPASSSPSSRPSIRNVGEDTGGMTVGGDEDKRRQIEDALSAVQEAQNAPPEQRDSLLANAIGMLTDIALLGTQTSAQLAPGTKATRPQAQSRSTRQIPEQMRDVEQPAGAAPVAQPATPRVGEATSDLEASARRQRNAQNAMAILQGGQPAEPVDLGTVARIQRAQTFMQDPEEEIRMSVRERPGRREANEDVRRIRNGFMDERGIEPEARIEDTYAEVDPDFAKRLADWYETAEVNYDDPKMLAAYRQFGKETLDQYKYLVDQGYEMIPWAGKGQPYADSADMIEDLRNNKRLYYYKTVNPEEANSFGSNPEAFREAMRKNPLLEDTGIEVLDSEGNPYKQTYNDLFRGVHDILGHGAEGFQFGPQGEENAYRSHAVMFSPLARQAMATETRAQNSWVNFGPNRRNPDGTVWGKEDPRYGPWMEKLKAGEGYADQKPVLTPPEFLGLYEAPQQARASLRPIAREEMTPAMQTWSEGSKVVDENGALIPVYHGTSKDKDFNKFKIGKRGAWFTTNPQDASMYAMQNDSMGFKSEPTPTDPWASRKTNTASRVIPAVLNLKNPAKYYKDVSAEDQKALETSQNYALAQARVFDKLRRQGFDGVDMGNGVYVAFEPNQIKGYFNANPTADERIMYSQAEEPAKQPSAAKIAANEQEKIEKAAKKAAAAQKRRESQIVRKRKEQSKSRREAGLEKTSISISAEVTAAPYINPNIITTTAQRDPQFSVQKAYDMINDQVAGLLSNNTYRKTLDRLVFEVTDGRVTSNGWTMEIGSVSGFGFAVEQKVNVPIGKPRRVLGSFKGRVEQSMRISIPGATHEDHVLVSNLLGSLLMQEATITIGAPTANTPKAEQSYAVMMYADPNISDADLRTLLTQADAQLGGASTIENAKGIFAVYTPYVGNPLTKSGFEAKAAAFAAANNLKITAAPVRSTYTVTGASDVLGRKRKEPARAGRGNRGDGGLDPRWSSWIEAAAPIVEAIRDEGFDINIPGWVGQVAGAEAPAVESALVDALAERAAGGRHGLDWRFIQRASVTGQGLTDGEAIPAKTTPANAEKSFREVDALLARHPNALKDTASFERFLIDLFKDRDIPIVPADLLAGAANNFDRMRKEMNLRANGGRLTPKMVDDAIHGLEMAQRLRALYAAGKVTPTHTVALAMWGFMSRGVSPYIQESLFLDIVNYRSKDGRDLSYFVNKAIAGEWTATQYDEDDKIILPDNSTETEWRGWVQEMFADAKYEVAADPVLNPDGDAVTKNGSVGAAASHNANAFGVSFLGNIGKSVTINGKTQSGLLHFHEALADPNTTGRQVRRVFASLGGSLGIDNKVVGFAALVAGKTDISVYDRVRVRDHFDRGGAYPNIYDGYTVGYAVRDGKKLVMQNVLDIDFKSMTDAQREALLADPKAQAEKKAEELNAGPRPLNKKGKPILATVEPVKIAGLANLFNGARGIALYEAVESSIDPNAIFADLVKTRPDLIPFAHLGAEHWLNWVAASAQEASHKTLDGLIQMISSGATTISNVWAKEGRYDTFHYGGEYGYKDVNGKLTAMYRYELNGTNWEFTPPQYNAFIKSLAAFDWAGLNWSKASKTKKPKFLVSKDSTTGKDRTEPWISDPLVGQTGVAKIAELADQFGTRMSLRDMTNADALDAFAVALHKAISLPPSIGNNPDPVQIQHSQDPVFLEFARQNLAAVTPQQAHELYLRMVKGSYPKPTQPRYTMYFDKNNALNGYNPNDVWWHGGRRGGWTNPDYNISPNQFGLHIGNFNQSSEFFDRGVRFGRPELRTPVLFPLYARAGKVIEIPDQGSWEPERILRGMKKMELITNDEHREILTDMYESLGLMSFINKHSPKAFDNAFAYGEVPGLAAPENIRTSANIFMRGWFDEQDIEAIVYQNDVEGKILSRYSQDPALGDVESDEVAESKRELARRMERLYEWNKKNELHATSKERYLMRKEIMGSNMAAIVWKVGSVKSASAEDVGFRTSMNDIRASIRLQPPAITNMYPEVFGLETPARFSQRMGLRGQADTATLMYIDQYEPLRRYGEIASQNIGSQLPDNANPYQGARVLTGRLASMQQEADRQYSHLMREMHDNRISLEQMDEFLTAQHALNGGNAYIAQKNPRFPDGGTGMTNADAQAVLMRAQAAGRYGEMNRIANDWRQLLREGLRLRRDSGLITNDLYNTLTTRYTHYVPLRGAPGRPFDELFEEYDAGNVFGRGLSTQGRGMPQRYGRASRAQGVTSQVGFLHEDTMKRVARNEIAQRFLRLVLLVNDPGMAVIVRPTRPVDMDLPATATLPERRETRYVHDANWMSNDRNFGVYINQPVTINGHDYEPGDLVVIQINNPDLALSINSPNAPLSQFAEALRSVHNAWRFVTTGMGNPAFAPLNAFRDIGSGLINNRAAHGMRDTVQMLRRYPRAFSQVFRDAWFYPDNPRGSYERFRRAGGDQLYWRPNDLETKNTDFQTLAERVARRDPNDRSLARDLLGWYPAFFTAAETATRLAQFEQRIATGSSPEQAALAARDITVDFAKGGKKKAGLNAFYVFLNASIQGSVNVVRATRQGRATAPALVLFGAVTAMLGRAMGGEDERTGGDNYDNIPDYDKTSNIILMDPRGTGKHIKIPLAYGYNVFYSAGVRMADAAMGKSTAGDAVAGMITDTLNSFNPFGGSGIRAGAGNVVAAFMPTMFRPVVEVGMNQNWMGRPIFPQSYGQQEKADSFNYFAGTPDVYVDVAQALNSATGGDMFESGYIDISPNTMQYLVGYYLSGAGRNLDRLVKIATMDEPVEASDIPLLRSFVGDASNDTRSLSERYNAIAARVMPDVRREEAGMTDPSVSLDVVADTMALGAAVTATDKELRAIRKAMKTATPEQRKELIEARERAMQRVIRENNRLTPD